MNFFYPIYSLRNILLVLAPNTNQFSFREHQVPRIQTEGAHNTLLHLFDKPLRKADNKFLRSQISFGEVFRFLHPTVNISSLLLYIDIVLQENFAETRWDQQPSVQTVSSWDFVEYCFFILVYLWLIWTKTGNKRDEGWSSGMGKIIWRDL